jgi:hypothetical protein
VVDCTGLENRQRETVREFESHRLRQSSKARDMRVFYLRLQRSAPQRGLALIGADVRRDIDETPSCVQPPPIFESLREAGFFLFAASALRAPEGLGAHRRRCPQGHRRNPISRPRPCMACGRSRARRMRRETLAHVPPPPIFESPRHAGFLFVLAFDLLRWLFPLRWLAKRWHATHLYKMCGALFGVISAFVGNVMVWGQPWSQLLPSVLGTFVIAYWLVRIARTGDRLELRTD